MFFVMAAHHRLRLVADPLTFTNHSKCHEDKSEIRDQYQHLSFCFSALSGALISTILAAVAPRWLSGYVRGSELPVKKCVI